VNPTIARAGERTLLYRIRQGSIPIDFDFTVTPVHPHQALGGALEVSASAWIFTSTPQRFPLQARHQLRRGFWNTFFSIEIIPAVDVHVTPVPVKRTAFGSAFFLAVAGVTLAIVLAALWLFLGNR
jgi:hypothetical protein